METIQISQRGRTFSVVPGRNRLFWRLVCSGDWEPETFAIFDRFIDKHSSYVDVGAWIGPTLLYGCQLARRSYGVEPDPVAYAELAENVRLNEALTAGVQISRICITPASGKVQIGNRGDGGDSTSSTLFKDGRTTWLADGLTFEDFMKQNGIVDCGFIKMDIEGGEYRLLPTMAPYLLAHRPTLHLSFHPRFLTRFQRSGVFVQLWCATFGFVGTIKLLQSLSFYKHHYDTKGRSLTCLRLLQLCRRGTFALVLTDSDWHTPTNAGPSRADTVQP